MNCKPGDLARIISNDETRYFGHADKIVRVIDLDGKKDAFGFPCWRLADPLFVRGEAMYSCSDNVLRRIDNPGDDAIDEVIQRIGTPHKETA